MSIRRLRLREQPEALRNEVRPRRQATIRCVYLASIAILALWLADMFLGGFFYLRSDGQVLAEPAVVAVEFPVTVRQIAVNEGDLVKAGQVVAVVSSQNVTESMANLTVALADRALQLAELQIRSATVNAVIVLAQTRRNVAIDTRQKYESLLSAGFLPLDKRSAVVENEFRSKEDLARLTAEQSALTAQIADLSQAVAEANDAVGRLRSLFDGGLVRAPIDRTTDGRQRGCPAAGPAAARALSECPLRSCILAYRRAVFGCAWRARGCEHRAAELHGHH